MQAMLSLRTHGSPRSRRKRRTRWLQLPGIGAATVLASLLLVQPAATLADARGALPQSGPVAARSVTEDWERLTQLRLAQRSARRREGLALLVWGAANTVAGAVAAGVKRDDRAWLSGSLTTLGFGAINAALAFGLLDVSGRRRAAILAQPTGPRGHWRALRDDERAAQLKSGQVFALNAGLDVFYLATGAFLLAMAQRGTRHADWERGVGAAFLMQGTFLLGFDIACWRGANRRAQALGSLR
jgi:hypothetical protein